MEAKTTQALDRVCDALLEGRPVEQGAWAKLTVEERAEVDALIATAVLTRTALQTGEPSPQAEAASLRRAQKAFVARPPLAPAAMPAPTDLRARIARWLGRK